MGQNQWIRYVWTYAHLGRCTPVYDTKVAGNSRVLYIKSGYYSMGMYEMCLL
jgi:hypothetical protein